MNKCMKCSHKNVCEWCIEDSNYDYPTCSDFLEEMNNEVKLQPTQRVTGKDYKMIQCMAFIKQYCKDVDGCITCPMFDNCITDNKPFPYFWYIPEV